MFRRNRRNAGAESPFWKQQGWILSAAFLAVALVMAGVTWLTGDDEQADRDRADGKKGPLSSAAAKGGEGQHGDGRPDGCRTDDSDKAKPTASPDDIEWRLLNIARVPVSSSAGPLRSSGPVMWCFARTPMGAVMAAHIIPTQMSGSDWRTVTEQQVVASPGRDIFVAQRSTVSESAQNGSAVGSYAGFAVTSYSPDAATVQLLIKNGSGGYGSTFVAVKWDGGDWKVKAKSNGALYTSMTTVSGNAGFTMWKA
ncbi:hypothetical protein ACH492_28180 [Streptomyces sp. NPDC019443]|uniref:hypothetical protein n=1 Tax=Streptomyces sp. NPDC019443 TaxID=3365061 RepID=UPI00378CDB96